MYTSNGIFTNYNSNPLNFRNALFVPEVFADRM